MSLFFKEQREDARAERAEARELAKQDRAELEARLAQHRDEMDAKVAELTAPAEDAVSEQALERLQARLEGLHATKLLADEELYSLEDTIADYVELKMSAAGRIVTREMCSVSPVASKVEKTVGISASMAGDAAFARQLRRKFL